MFTDNKGFTLIELIATITIMALVSIAAIPSLTNIISNNEKKRFDYYSISMEKAARTYYNREKKDIFENIDTYNRLIDSNSDKLGFVVCLDDLMNSNLLEEIGSGYTCHGGVNIVLKNKNVTFTPFLKCKEGTDWTYSELVYQTRIDSVPDGNYGCSY